MHITHNLIQAKIQTRAGVEIFNIRQHGAIYHIVKAGTNRITWKADSLDCALAILHEYEELSK